MPFTEAKTQKFEVAAGCRWWGRRNRVVRLKNQNGSELCRNINSSYKRYCSLLSKDRRGRRIANACGEPPPAFENCPAVWVARLARFRSPIKAICKGLSCADGFRDAVYPDGAFANTEQCWRQSGMRCACFRVSKPCDCSLQGLVLNALYQSKSCVFRSQSMFLKRKSSFYIGKSAFS